MAATTDEHPSMGKRQGRLENKIAIVTGSALVVDGGQTIDG